MGSRSTIKVPTIACVLNLFQGNIPFLYPLEKLWCSDIFKMEGGGRRNKKRIAFNGLIMTPQNIDLQ